MLALGHVDLHFIPYLWDGSRVITGANLASALEHAYLLPGSTEARCRNRSAIARANYYDLIVLL
jgi:hypothetical protein